MNHCDDISFTLGEIAKITEDPFAPKPGDLIRLTADFYFTKPDGLLMRNKSGVRYASINHGYVETSDSMLFLGYRMTSYDYDTKVQYIDLIFYNIRLEKKLINMWTLYSWMLHSDRVDSARHFFENEVEIIGVAS